MGAFNTVRATLACPACGKVGEFEIQFEYRIGDALRWGGNQVGRPGAGRVRVEGLAA